MFQVSGWTVFRPAPDEGAQETGVVPRAAPIFLLPGLQDLKEAAAGDAAAVAPNAIRADATARAIVPQGDCRTPPRARTVVRDQLGQTRGP
ncbi:hypothetical protein ACMHYO_11495 [Allopusillimonas ginsengisoli]|uniref:hypothetical protein n=1 Tax=Allopusillimonas ginsengisoli TaxID=453575 RepID=UPI0039C2BCB0